MWQERMGVEVKQGAKLDAACYWRGSGQAGPWARSETGHVEEAVFRGGAGQERKKASKCDVTDAGSASESGTMLARMGRETRRG